MAQDAENKGCLNLGKAQPQTKYLYHDVKAQKNIAEEVMKECEGTGEGGYDILSSKHDKAKASTNLQQLWIPTLGIRTWDLLTVSYQGEGTYGALLFTAELFATNRFWEGEHGVPLYSYS